MVNSQNISSLSKNVLKTSRFWWSEWHKVMSEFSQRQRRPVSSPCLNLGQGQPQQLPPSMIWWSGTALYVKQWNPQNQFFCHDFTQITGIKCCIFQEAPTHTHITQAHIHTCWHAHIYTQLPWCKNTRSAALQTVRCVPSFKERVSIKNTFVKPVNEAVCRLSGFIDEQSHLALQYNLFQYL